PSSRNRAAVLPKHEWRFAVHPNFRVIVHDDFKCHGRTFCVEAGNLLRDGDVDAIPVERKPSVAAPAFERIGSNTFPLAVVEIRRPGVRRKIERVILRSVGFQICADVTVLDLTNGCIAVTPPRVHPRATREPRSFVARREMSWPRFRGLPPWLRRKNQKALILQAIAAVHVHEPLRGTAIAIGAITMNNETNLMTRVESKPTLGSDWVD